MKFGPNNNLWLGTNNSGLVKISNPTLNIISPEKKEKCIFPTIFNYEINIELNNYSSIKIISQQGGVLKKMSLESGMHQINTTQLESGLYFILIQTENHNLVEKIIKY